ncbi:hypothetical protein SAMN02983004_01164 [Borreliella japonica]|uniref:Lipoprotein n=1 Tax=Borreliella japonica TaxID=34095 RepID=A0A1G4QMJ5_BORJA|nr:hypothetical protein SAMN02983004_01164 [Borreliella japonica]
MKKSISILNIFFFISCFYSCFLVPESFKNVETGISGFELIEKDNEKDIKEDKKNIPSIDKESMLIEIKEGEVYGGLFAGYVTWAKSG